MGIENDELLHNSLEFSFIPNSEIKKRILELMGARAYWNLLPQVNPLADPEESRLMVEILDTQLEKLGKTVDEK